MNGKKFLLFVLGSIFTIVMTIVLGVKGLLATILVALISLIISGMFRNGLEYVLAFLAGVAYTILVSLLIAVLTM